MMNLEMRPVMFEDLGRQVLAHGRRKRAYEYLEAIGKLLKIFFLILMHKFFIKIFIFTTGWSSFYCLNSTAY